MKRFKVATCSLALALGTSFSYASPVCHIPTTLIHDPCVRSVTVRISAQICSVTAVMACPTWQSRIHLFHASNSSPRSPCFVFNGKKVCD